MGKSALASAIKKRWAWSGNDEGTGRMGVHHHRSFPVEALAARNETGRPRRLERSECCVLRMRAEYNPSLDDGLVVVDDAMADWKAWA
jgi:hypothetical protein